MARQGGLTEGPRLERGYHIQGRIGTDHAKQWQSKSNLISHIPFEIERRFAFERYLVKLSN